MSGFCMNVFLKNLMGPPIAFKFVGTLTFSHFVFQSLFLHSLFRVLDIRFTKFKKFGDSFGFLRARSWFGGGVNTTTKPTPSLVDFCKSFSRHLYPTRGHQRVRADPRHRKTRPLPHRRRGFLHSLKYCANERRLQVLVIRLPNRLKEPRATGRVLCRMCVWD